MQETVTILLRTGHKATREPVEIPARVGTVRLGQKLGEGAGGVVLAGFDEALHRRVAVKLLHRPRECDTEAAWFGLIEGVRNASSVRHPHILTIHAVEMVGDVPAIIMEYVDGLSLRELLRRPGGRDAQIGLYVMHATVTAVAVLHEAGVVHRDLKPANVLIDQEGHVRVCDFGLACDLGVAVVRSREADVGGSPLYMAPEAFDGQVSPQGDVYSLGVMLFEVLTGDVPFTADTINEIKQCHAHREPPAHLLEQKQVAPELAEVVSRAMRKQRFLRYKTAGHMLRALDRSWPAGRDVRKLRQRVSRLVAGEPLDTPSPEPTGGHGARGTIFDVVARRAAEKRRRRQ